MFFDAVLDKDMQPVFNGTPEETRKWLYDQPKENVAGYRVIVGQTLANLSIDEYLRGDIF